MNNKQEKQILNTETRHGQVAGQSTKPLDQEFIMNNFNTNLSSDQLNGKIPQLPKEACLPEGLGSDACPWLDEYVDFSRIWSPLSYDGYYEGCGLFTLSTVAARRVTYDFNGVKATNLYIGLLGDTGVHSKSTAAQIGVKLLRTTGLDWLLASDQSTPQKLIADMASKSLPSNFTDLDEENQKKEILRGLTAGQCGWYVDEFDDYISVMMRPESMMFGIKGLIRTLDGAPKEYKYSTISRGDNHIQYPYLTILGNITIVGLSQYAKKGTTLWGDGTLARFALITPNNSSIKFGKIPNKHRVFPESLITPLVNWHERLGLPTYEIVKSENQRVLKYSPLQPHNLTLEGDAYDAFYRYHDALRAFIVNKIPQDLAGNYARFPEKALRIAALFASFDNGDFIELNHWAKAQGIAERWRVGLHELYRQINDISLDQSTTFVKSLPVEDQILRAVGVKKMPDMREISQYTGFKKDIVEPALAQLVLENKLTELNDNGKNRFMLSK